MQTITTASGNGELRENATYSSPRRQGIPLRMLDKTAMSLSSSPKMMQGKCAASGNTLASPRQWAAILRLLSERSKPKRRDGNRLAAQPESAVRPGAGAPYNSSRLRTFTCDISSAHAEPKFNPYTAAAKIEDDVLVGA